MYFLVNEKEANSRYSIQRVVNNLRYYHYFYINPIRFHISFILLSQFTFNKFRLFCATQPKSLWIIKFFKIHVVGGMISWITPMIMSSWPSLAECQFIALPGYGVGWLFNALLHDNPHKKQLS